jgi:DNA-binding response OmpR family regulator
MAKILIVEDEPEMARGLRDNFEFDGHTVSVAVDGEVGLQMAGEPGIDLIILDVMLPKKSGLDLCRELRAARITTPVIMLTARGQEIDKVLGLELGADDYITKPFSVRELLARVKAVLRRAGERDESGLVRMGRLSLDFASYHAEDTGGEVELTHKEFEILKYMHLHRGETISRDQLLNDVWGYDASPTSRTVDNHILMLRKKVEEDPEHPRHILTVHRVGYKYVE